MYSSHWHFNFTNSVQFCLLRMMLFEYVIYKESTADYLISSFKVITFGMFDLHHSVATLGICLYYFEKIHH